MSKILYNALRTPDGTIIESRNRHDYQTYTDANGKEYMIDGGLDYVRSSAHEDQEWVGITMDDPIEKIREHVTWGTRGPKGDQPLTYVKLSEMSIDHIQAVLDTQTRIYPQLRDALKCELEYRETTSNDFITTN